MTKQLFLAFLFSLTSIALSPAYLAASDSESFVAHQPDFDSFERYLSQKIATSSQNPTPVVATEQNWAATITEPILPRLASAPVVAAPAAGQQTITYTITKSISSITEYNNIGVNPSYSDIYRFNRLIFAHNSANLLGSLASLTPGQTINIAENGQGRAFRVAAVEQVENTPDGLAGDREYINKLAFRAKGHSYALLTCAGTMYGNGNASHRLIVYVDAV